MKCCGFGVSAQWRELPEKYPPNQTAHGIFPQWVRSGRRTLDSRVNSKDCNRIIKRL